MMGCKSNTSTEANCSRNEQKQQALTTVMLDLKRAEERAEKENWIDADDLEKELQAG